MLMFITPVPTGKLLTGLRHNHSSYFLFVLLDILEVMEICETKFVSNIHTSLFIYNRIGGVMASVRDSSAVDRGF